MLCPFGTSGWVTSSGPAAVASYNWLADSALWEVLQVLRRRRHRRPVSRRAAPWSGAACPCTAFARRGASRRRGSGHRSRCSSCRPRRRPLFLLHCEFIAWESVSHKDDKRSPYFYETAVALRSLWIMIGRLFVVVRLNHLKEAFTSQRSMAS